MEIIPKLNLNRNPKDVPSNSIVAAKNIMTDDTGSYITNEYGFKIAFDCPNQHEFICGVIPTNKELIIFTYDTETKTSRIYRFSDGIANECNIGWEYSGGKITGSYTYNYKGELIIAVGEYDAIDSNGNTIQVPFKCWNLDNCIDVSHNQEEEIGKINATYDIVSGNLVCGVYTIFIRFAINDYDYTKWFQITPEIIIIDSVNKEAPTHTFIYTDGLATLQTDDKFVGLKVNSNKISDKGISLNINIDEHFSKYQIGYIIKHDEEVLGRIQNTYNSNTSNIVISDNIFAEEESIDKLLESPNQIYNVKNIITYNNRIYLSNYEEYKNENLNTDVVIANKNKSIDAETKTISKTNINCQIFFKSNYDNVASIFNVSNVTRNGETYKVNNVSQFIIDNFVNNIKVYNTKGVGTSIANDQYPELTEEGKKHYRYVREDFTLYLCHKTKKQYTAIYSTTDKKVRNINSISFYKKNNGKTVLGINANYKTPTGVAEGLNYDLDDLFYEILIEGTYYITWEEANGLDNPSYEYNKPGYYNKFTGESTTPLNGKYNGRYPTGGYAFEQSIVINTTSYSYDKNKDSIYRSLIPHQKYNIFIHYIRKDGSCTNGYFVNQIDTNSINDINYLTITNNYIPIGYIGYFYSYEDVEYNAIPVLGIESKESNNIHDDKFTNTDFIYGSNNIYGDGIYGFTFDGDTISKQYNRKATSTPNVEVVNAKTNAVIKGRYIFTSNNTNYTKKVKTLYRLTDNIYKVGDVDVQDYIPNFFNKEKVIVYSEASDNTKLGDFIFNPTSSKVVTDKGSETHYDIWLYNVYNYSINPLDAYNIKQDYSKGAASLVSSTGSTLGVFYNSVLSPDKLHDFLEIKAAYTNKPSKSFTNYSKDYIDTFNKTVRRSNIVSDESPINGFKELDAEQYKIIKENKGNITNIVGIGLYLLVHTQYSLFVFDRTPKLTQSSQLQIPDVFDIDYQEVLPSNEGFGGLWNKEESILSKNGYIWYDKVNKYIFKYENGKCEVLSSDINNFIKDIDIDTIRFGEDLKTNRLIICIYIKVNDITYNITLSYNFNTKTFISLHDYTFTNCYRTYNQAYFFDSNKDKNRLYVFDDNENGYRNLKNETSLYYPTYISNAKSTTSDDNESKENPGFDEDPDRIDCIKKAFVINEHKIQLLFDKDLIKPYTCFRLYYAKGDNDYVEANYRYFFSALKENGIIDVETRYINFYNNNSGTLADKDYFVYCVLYKSEDDANRKVNGVKTTILTFNVDTALLDLNKITIHNEVNFDGSDYIINDYISFEHLNTLVLPLYVRIQFDNKNIYYFNIAIVDKIELAKSTYYKLTIGFANTDCKITKTIIHELPDFKNAIISRNGDNVIIKDNIDAETERVYNIELYRDDTKLKEKDAVFTTSTKEDSITIESKIANKANISCLMNNATYKYSININDNIITPSIIHTNAGKIIIYSNDNNAATKTYYSIDDSKYSEYTDELTLNDGQTIKVYNRYIEDETNYDSEVISFTYYKDVQNGIESLEYSKVQAVNKVFKNYVDIIYCKDVESTKSLESIQYILDNINAPFGTINLAEQAFSKTKDDGGRFSGNNIVLYSDETYSGEIDINDNGDTNTMDNYKYPTFQKGHWEFNYFRNNGLACLTKEELNSIYTNIPYVDSNGETIIATITLNDLYKSFGVTSTDSGFTLRSDNRSLIYGKYIVARFIFNNDKKIKLQNVTFITNNY